MRHLASKLLWGASLLVIFSLILVPAVQAQEYNLLDPTFLGQDPSQTKFSKDKDFVDYAKVVYQTILLVVVVLSIIMIALGGIEYVASGAAGAKLEGKERIWNAIIGLLIALASFLILYTIDPSLVSFNLDLGTPIEVSTRPSGPGTGNGGGGVTPGDDLGTVNTGGRGRGEKADLNRFKEGSPGVGDYGYVPGDEFAARDQITQATGGKVTFNDTGPGCNKETGNVADCRTYVGGMTQDQVNGIIALQKECNCNIVISGAAEQGGHSLKYVNGRSTHYSGLAVDIRSTSSINPFMESLYKENKPLVQTLGIKFINDERRIPGVEPHWHVEF